MAAATARPTTTPAKPFLLSLAEDGLVLVEGDAPAVGPPSGALGVGSDKEALELDPAVGAPIGQPVMDCVCPECV